MTAFYFAVAFGVFLYAIDHGDKFDLPKDVIWKTVLALLLALGWPLLLGRMLAGYTGDMKYYEEQREAKEAGK